MRVGKSLEKWIFFLQIFIKVEIFIKGIQSKGVRLFARRTFTTPKIRTFTTPKKNICQEDNCHPHFFFFFWRTFLGFFDLQLMEDIKDGKEEVLDEVVMEHIK